VDSGYTESVYPGKLRIPSNTLLSILMMESIINYMQTIASDNSMFFLLQGSLFLAFFYVLTREGIAKSCAGKGGVTATVERGSNSMAKFYGAYLALNGLLVAICLSVEIAKNYRIMWVVIDTAIPAYICLLNPWSRNALLTLSIKLTKIEAR
jgi:hypothetical protein